MENNQYFRELLDNIAGVPQQNVITARDLYELRDSMERPPPATQPIINFDAYHHRFVGHLGDLHCIHQLLGMEDFEERMHIQERMRENLIRAQSNSDHAVDATQHRIDMHRMELQALQDRMSAATTFAEGRELEARHNTVRELLRRAEDEYMATGTFANTTWTTIPSVTSYNAPTSKPDDPVLLFQMKQNTHAVELRKLRNSYAESVFLYDFSIPIWKQFPEHKCAIQDYMDTVRRLITAKNAYINQTKEKYRQTLINIFLSSMSNRELDFIMDNTSSLVLTRPYVEYKGALDDYRIRRLEFKRFQERYGEKQADHNRRAAMIRQKPELYITINRQSIADTIMSWDNVWAVDTHVDNGTNVLYVRIGLCNIVMSESAQESYYDEPQDILLAPFYVTLKISATGNIIVSSREEQIRGLSRSNPGQMSYDVHPHQLSDAPCFGTFGQTLIDLGNNGDFISYIGTLIAFYSQYNSQDSAGVAARSYHPSNLCIWEDEARYKFRLCEGMRSYGKHLALDENKLDAAMEEYKEYYQENNGRRPPEIHETELCASCENEPVGDNDTYYVTAYDSRVCIGCWEDHYCDTCERTNDDCECEPEE